MPVTLNRYLEQSQRFMRDQNQLKLDPADLISYINRARREVAMRSQCIRVLPPISGQIVSASVTAPGTGYASIPTVSITPPDFPSGLLPFPNGLQATALAITQNGTVSAVDIQQGGSGYFQPQMTITGGGGAGASVVPVLSPMNLLKIGQEKYDFSKVDLSQFPGVSEIYFVRSVSVIYSNYRYTLPMYPFSVYQAYVRQYPFQYQYVPTFCSQFGQGAGGSIYMYPLPSQTYQMDWDCLGMPQDLEDDLSVEAIPDPWTDAVPYMVAHLAMLELQNFNAATGYLALYDQFAQRYSNYARIGRTINPYGRY
jgi:hypothetical protein